MDENMEYYPTVSGNNAYVPGNDPAGSDLLENILDTLNSTQSYGTIGDYYFQALGCYVFPNFEVYEYFIDTDAVGHEWAEATDGHYVPLLYLEKYEEYITAAEETEEPEAVEETLQDENELQNLETLESIRGLLSVIKENNAAYYDEVLEYQTEMLETAQKSAAYEEGMFYCGIITCILIGILAGSFISHVFFGRMRAG